MRQMLSAAMLALTLGALPAQAEVWSVFGINGNDTGGIIPWSPENEVRAPAMAQAHCARFRKYARATSIVRQYGYYIGFECVWSPSVRP
jgi:hypothetical protein